jgi:hypothetical protein
LLGQTPAIRSRFEVASVRAAAKDETGNPRLSEILHEVAAATGDPARFR